MQNLCILTIWLAGLCCKSTSLAVAPNTAAHNSVDNVNSVDIWSSTSADHESRSTSLSIRGEHTVAMWQAFVGSMTAVVIGICSTPFSAMMGNAPCVAAAFGAGLMTVASFIGLLKSQRERLETGMSTVADHDEDAYISWEYPGIAGGSDMYERVVHAHDVAFNDGLPVLVGHTTCTSEWNTCHRVWYSKWLANDGRTTHRVHATAPDFDFRSPDNVLTPSSSRRMDRRQEEEGGQATTTKGTTYDMTYTWVPENPEAMDYLISNGYHSFTDQVLEQMNAQNEATGEFSRQGTYCMDFSVPPTGGHDNAVMGTAGYAQVWNPKDGSPPAGDVASCGSENVKTIMKRTYLGVTNMSQTAREKPHFGYQSELAG